MSSWQNHLLRLAQFGFRAAYGHFTQLEVEQERRQMAAGEKLFKPPAGVQVSAAVMATVPAEWISAAGAAAQRAVLYLHGGAFYSGSLAGTRPIAAEIALAGRARVLSIDYRLTPEHPFPAALDDARAAYEWLLAGGWPPGNIALVGDSAGGNLVLALLIHLRDLGRPLPAGAAALSPTVDLTLSGETWARNARRDLLLNPEKIRAAIDLYLQGTDPRHPLASPLYADLHGLPPLLILVGSEEQLLSDATRFADKARAAGVAVTLEVWEGMQHGWHILHRFLPEGRRALAQIGAFIQHKGPQ